MPHKYPLSRCTPPAVGTNSTLDSPQHRARSWGNEVQHVQTITCATAAPTLALDGPADATLNLQMGGGGNAACWAGAYTRPLISSTVSAQPAVPNTTKTLNTPYYPLSPPKLPLKNP
jgi:hypothetical protein